MAVKGWQLKAGVLAVFVIAVTVAAVVFGLGSGSSDADSSPTATHRARAVSETGRLLDAARLPGGATVRTTSDAGVQTRTLQLITAPTAANVITSTRIWSVPEAGARVRTFLRAHPPTGTHLASSSAPASEVVQTIDRLPPGLSADRIVFVLSRSGPHTTLVRASATATWIVARPATEVVPAAARVVDVYRGQPGTNPGISLKVTDPQFTQIKTLIDRLPPVQPGVAHCPVAIPGLPRVTFVFRAHEGGPALAVADEDADVVAPTTACNAMRFEIGGHAGTPLLGGATLLRAVSPIVHHRLWLAPYAA